MVNRDELKAAYEDLYRIIKPHMDAYLGKDGFESIVHRAVIYPVYFVIDADFRLKDARGGSSRNRNKELSKFYYIPAFETLDAEYRRLAGMPSPEGPQETERYLSGLSEKAEYCATVQ